jgi:hypothetical protein
MGEVVLGNVVMRITIPKGNFCKDRGFLTDVPEGYCFLFGYLKYYNKEEKSYERDNMCHLYYPNGKVIFAIEGEENEFSSSKT